MCTTHIFNNMKLYCSERLPIIPWYMNVKYMKDFGLFSATFGYIIALMFGVLLPLNINTSSLLFGVLPFIIVILGAALSVFLFLFASYGNRWGLKLRKSPLGRLTLALVFSTFIYAPVFSFNYLYGKPGLIFSFIGSYLLLFVCFFGTILGITLSLVMREEKMKLGKKRKSNAA